MKTLPPGYKRGSHGFIFRWNGFEYVKADYDPTYRKRLISSSGKDTNEPPRLKLIDGKKLCKGKHGCGELKPISEFNKHGIYLMTYCKKCDSKRTNNAQKQKRRAA